MGSSLSTEGYHPRALALVGGFGPVIRRASLGGLAAGIVAGTIAWLVMPAVVPPLAQFAILVTLPVVLGTTVAFILVPGPMRRAYEAFSWLGHREVARFKAATGSSIPVGADAVREWLALNPVGPVTGEARVELLVAIGQFGQARTEFSRLPPPETDFERLTRASLRTWGELVETGVVDLDAFDAVAARLPPGSDAALEGEVIRALARTRMALLGEEPDPMRPLREVRPKLGRDATRVVIRDTWIPIAGQLLAFGLLIGSVAALTRSGVL